jgi:hypothetical protein
VFESIVVVELLVVVDGFLVFSLCEPYEHLRSFKFFLELLQNCVVTKELEH